MYCSMYRKQPHYYRGADSILNILLCHIEWYDGVMVSILHPGLCGRVTAFCSSARHLTTCSSHSDSLHHMYYVYRASDRSLKKKSNFAGFSESHLWKQKWLFHEKFTEIFGTNFAEKQSVKNVQFHGKFLHIIILLQSVQFCTDLTSV